MKEIKIYTTNWCPYCVAAKRFFDEKGWPYEEINIAEKDWNREKLFEVGKSMTVPQIVIDGEAIGGYDDLMQLYG
jgi:glutaredoxin